MGWGISRFATAGGESRSLIDNLLDFIGLCTACIGRYNFTEGGPGHRPDARIHARMHQTHFVRLVTRTLISQARHVSVSVVAASLKRMPRTLYYEGRFSNMNSTEIAFGNRGHARLRSKEQEKLLRPMNHIRCIHYVIILYPLVYTPEHKL